MRLTEIPKEQLENFMGVVMTLADSIASTQPSLNPDIKKVVDFHKSTVGGMLLAVRAMFGKESSDDLLTALKQAVLTRHGVDFNIATTLIDEAAESGAFKEWLLQNRSWAPPEK